MGKISKKQQNEAKRLLAIASANKNGETDTTNKEQSKMISSSNSNSTTNNVVLALPLIIPSGSRKVLVIKEHDNVTEVTTRFCLGYSVSDYKDSDVCRNLVNKATSLFEERTSRKVLLSLPVTVPDGRKVFCDIRDGEQHDLSLPVITFMDGYSLPRTSATTLINEAKKRLPPPLITLNVNLTADKAVGLRITSEDEKIMEEEITLFCKINNVPSENINILKQKVMSLLYPETMVL